MSPTPDHEGTKPNEGTKCPFCMRDMPQKSEDKRGYDAVVSALDSVRDILGTMRAVVMEMQRNDDDER